jgi:hypothetical protein
MVKNVSSMQPIRLIFETSTYNWLSAFTQELNSLNACIQVTGIQAHIGYLGNELANFFGKVDVLQLFSAPQFNLSCDRRFAFLYMGFRSPTNLVRMSYFM